MKESTPERIHPLKRLGIAIGLGITTVALVVGAQACKIPERSSELHEEMYPLHQDIATTVFWVGETADETNDFIANRSSAWVEDWQAAYGGIDDPDRRCDHLPCNFIPRENPFYFALPYNDLDDKGNRKPSAKNIPWYTPQAETHNKSILKNRWIKVTFGDRVAYAQWEDTGPFEYDDFNYVFGQNSPKSTRAGLDLSPATTSFLGLDGYDHVSWQFVDEQSVAEGPWRKVVTTSK